MPDIVQNIIAAVGLAIVAGLGFYLFYLDGSSTLDSERVSEVDVTEMQATDFRQAITQLQSVSLDTSVISDTRFRSLVEHSTEVTPDSVGRDNPFSTN